MISLTQNQITGTYAYHTIIYKNLRHSHISYWISQKSHQKREILEKISIDKGNTYTGIEFYNDFFLISLQEASQWKKKRIFLLIFKL